MRAHHARAIGYSCLAAMLFLILVGLVAGKTRLVSLGGFALFLPTFAYFGIRMSFLAGLQILKTLWMPFWGRLVKLGDVAYLPYMAAVYPPALVGVDIRKPLAHLLSDLGLLIFCLGVLAWFYARFQKKGTADFWLYRYSRHPQYLGWIVWSYGLMLQAAQRRDCPPWDINPGGSLPWLLSALAIVCVALGEELKMRRARGQEYEIYQARAPFMLPLPAFVTRAATAPLRVLLKKDRPETRWELFLTFIIYAAILISFSLPFVLLNWPAGRGWMDWPFDGGGDIL